MTLHPSEAEFFDALYRRRRDPWDFADDPYEQARFRRIVDELSEPHFSRAFEPGCAEGELTVKLAPRCGHLLALDLAATAARRARERCRELANVNVGCGPADQGLEKGPFDLIVLSEVLYYFSEAELTRFVGQVGDALAPGAQVVAASWLGESTDHQLSGERAHQLVRTIAEDRGWGGHRHERLTDPRRVGFIIESWRVW